MEPAPRNRPGGQGRGVLDRADGDDGVIPEMGTDEQRLVVGVADDPDPGPGVHPVEVGVELGPELGVLDVVDDPDEAVRAEDGQAAPSWSRGGNVIVRPVEQIGDAILAGRDAEKSAHAVLLDAERSVDARLVVHHKRIGGPAQELDPSFAAAGVSHFH